MKSIVVVAMLFLLTFSACGTTFLQTFDDRNLKNLQELNQHNVSGFWKTINGELKAISRGEVTHLLTTRDETCQNYNTEIDVKPLKKHGLGNIAIAVQIQGAWLVYCTIDDLPFRGEAASAAELAGNFYDHSSVIFHFETSLFLRLNE